MNRQFQRWWQLRKEARVAPRLREVLAEIGIAIPELVQAKAERSGHRGHDTTFFLQVDGQPRAVLRLNNPHTTRPLPRPRMPFRLDPPRERITHELAAYRLGSQHGLTPTPIWHTYDALLCRYEPCEPLMERLTPENCWSLLSAASRAVHPLHGLGMTHMDMSLSNLLADAHRILIVDFEYTPIPALNVASQRAYDHLRLLESIWKFVPLQRRDDFGPWLAEVGLYLGTAAFEVQLDLLAPALGRLMAHSPLKSALETLFPAAAETAA